MFIKKNFILCEKCGKKLIVRMQNGLWEFHFGRGLSPDEIVSLRATQDVVVSDDELRGPPVEILIHGSLKMRCLNRLCRHWNTLHYFPNVK